MTSYKATVAILEPLTKSEPGIADWQRDLSVSYEKVGNVQLAQGNLPAALASYQASLVIRDRLAQSDPDNAGWQRDLSASYDKVGDVQVAQGNLPAALASYQASLVIAGRLAQSDPGNAGWQRDLIVSYVKIAQLDPSKAKAMLTQADEVLSQMQSRGQLAPRDAWMPAELARLIAELPK